MFRILLSLVLGSFIFSVSCQNAQEKKDDGTLSPDLITNPATAGAEQGKAVPVISFDKTTHDFGMMTDGEKLNYSFHFTNTGNTDLIIRHCQASCGCTVPEWPKDPVPPGKDAYISVTFNSEGKVGMVHKTISIMSNTIPNTATLVITGEVKPK